MVSLVDVLIGGENKYVEFKEKYSKSMLKTVSAYANYHDGRIIIGVSDSGLLVGVDEPERIRLSIENTINDSIDPRPDYEVEQRTVDGKTVLIFNVYKGIRSPYILSKKTYRRTDTSTVEVNRYEYESLILEGRNLSYEELENPEEKLSFDKLAKQISERLDIENFDNNILKSLVLIRDNHYTNAAMLFADKNTTGNNGLNLICYQDQEMLIFKDRQSADRTSLLSQYEQAMMFYRKHINSGDVIRGPYRESYEEVPEVAYREAVANAIIHRDYRRSGSNRIEIFPDRVEITSIGGLPFGISEREYSHGSCSILRNRVIADIFLRLRIIEKIGSGVRRIKRAYSNRDSSPEFRVFENTVQVVLPRASIEELTSIKNIRALNLVPEEDKLYQFILSSDGVTRADVEAFLSVKKTKATKLLNELIDKNVVIRTGSGKGMRYKAR